MAPENTSTSSTFSIGTSQKHSPLARTWNWLVNCSHCFSNLFLSSVISPSTQNRCWPKKRKPRINRRKNTWQCLPRSKSRLLKDWNRLRSWRKRKKSQKKSWPSYTKRSKRTIWTASRSCAATETNRRRRVSQTGRSWASSKSCSASSSCSPSSVRSFSQNKRPPHRTIISNF